MIDSLLLLVEYDIIVLSYLFNFNSFPESLRLSADLPPFHIIGNLPFNVSTPILVRWLRSISLRSQAWSQGRVPMTLTFQKEVADRIIAPMLSKNRL